jgi:hypothetical protein
LTDGFRRRVPGQLGELRIDVFDLTVAISDEDRGRAVLDRLRELSHLREGLLLFTDIACIDRHRDDRTIGRKGGKVPALVRSRADLALAVDDRRCRGDLLNCRLFLFRLVRRKESIEVITDGITYS